jgi:hypothetical protein
LPNGLRIDKTVINDDNRPSNTVPLPGVAMFIVSVINDRKRAELILRSPEWNFHGFLRSHGIESGHAAGFIDAALAVPTLKELNRIRKAAEKAEAKALAASVAEPLVAEPSVAEASDAEASDAAASGAADPAPQVAKTTAHVSHKRCRIEYVDETDDEVESSRHERADLRISLQRDRDAAASL